MVEAKSYYSTWLQFDTFIQLERASGLGGRRYQLERQIWQFQYQISSFHVQLMPANANAKVTLVSLTHSTVFMLCSVYVKI